MKNDIKYQMIHLYIKKKVINKTDKSIPVIVILINILSLIILFSIEIIKLKNEIKEVNDSYIKEKYLYSTNANIIDILQKHKEHKLNPSYQIDASQYNNDYLQFYIENRIEFYIYERKKIMNGIGNDYDDNNIITFQDKLNWLIIHESPEYKSKIVDRILMHKYSKKILGKDICIPILKIYNSINDINLTELPDQFSLNCNHGYEMNITCLDKNNFNLDKVKRQLTSWLDINYGLYSSEFQYIYINKKVYAEVYLGKVSEYSVYCFNGIAKFVKGKGNNYYDTNWQLTDIDPFRNGIDAKLYDRPKNLDLMLEYAEKLSKQFVFLKVVFYAKNNKIYLYNLNFSPSNVKMTFKNFAQSLYLGSLLNISAVRNFSSQDII